MLQLAPTAMSGSPASFFLLFSIVSIVAWISRAIYNLYFHPLAKYPGPFLARASTLWRFRQSMSGRFHRIIEKNHRKYGPVFRVGPNELSFASVTAFRTIYGLPNSPAPKNEWYDMLAAGFDEYCIVSERDPRKHSEKRAMFAAVFTQKALLAQEPTIQRYVDQFVEKVGKLGRGAKGLDMVKWYQMVSFDIFGELGFGETFGCIESETTHHWLDMILDHLLVVNIMDNLRRYPLLVSIVKALPAKWTSGLAKQQTQFSRDQVKRRLERDLDQQDFVSTAVSKVRKGEISEGQLVAHASTLVMAGGETTSTAMAAVTYYLLKSPSSYKKLNEEIRERYRNFDEIDIISTGQLPYLQAVLKEGMRMYVPGPQGLPRTSPGMTVDDHFVPAGTEFYVSSWTVARDSKYWSEPDVFKPERWIDPDSKDTREASQPFGQGPRMCIGRSFAYAQMSLELSKLVWTYDMELVDQNLDFEAESGMFFQWRKPALFIKFEKRGSA
ncbi:cytochrome protein [Astrocystis sublimbata]|nr:cytochrome protein [Astrocystis sublimbata]